MTQVRAIMTTELVVVSPDVTLRDAVELLAREHLTGAPVLAGGKVVGVVSLGDIASLEADLPGVPAQGSEELAWDGEVPAEPEEGAEADGAFFVDAWEDVGAPLTERFENVEGPEWDFLSEHTVSEAMTRKLWTIGPDEPIATAARRMSEAQVHRLLVLDQGRLAGIVTTSDVTRAVAKGWA